MTVLGGVTPVGALLACVGTWRAQTAPPILPTNGFFALDLASLSLAPVDCAGRGLVQTGKDVLVLACFLLACFLLSERDNPDFAKAFEHGILPWLEKEQPKYKATRWASMGWARLRTRRRFATGAAGRSSAASDEYVVHLPDGRRLPRLTETYRLPRLPPEEGASVGGSECSRDRV